MIAQIQGKIVQRNPNCLLIDVHGLCYEVLIPTAIMQRIEKNSSNDGQIKLITYHYHQVEPSKSVPILIGFSNEVERDFFEQFISVSGIGPRAALRAISQPISLIARAIDEGDIVFLKSLPGIGQQRAREIVAKLQGKIGKFGLIQDKEIHSIRETKNLEEEALQVLLQLQYKHSEALQMIEKVLQRKPNIETIEELLNEVYHQNKD